MSTLKLGVEHFVGVRKIEENIFFTPTDRTLFLRRRCPR